MISPFKAALGLDYKAFENRLLAAIHMRFGLPPQTPAETAAANQDGGPDRGLSRSDAACRIFGARGGKSSSAAQAAGDGEGRGPCGSLKPLPPMMRRRPISRSSQLLRQMTHDHRLSTFCGAGLVDEHAVGQVVSLLGPETPHRTFNGIAADRHLQADLSRYRRNDGRFCRAARRMRKSSSSSSKRWDRADPHAHPLLGRDQPFDRRGLYGAVHAAAQAMQRSACHELRARLALGHAQPADRLLCRCAARPRRPHGRRRRCDRPRRDAFEGVPFTLMP